MMMKKNENTLIKWWKRYFKEWSKKTKIKLKLTDDELKEEIKRHATNQLELIEQSRPNKEKTAKEQANKLQLEYLEWLEKVIETGNLDNDL